MRILISAYACESGKGSEPEVGLRIALTAASKHEVWVITRENHLLALRAFLNNHPLRDKIHLIGIDVDGLPRRAKERGGLVTQHWYLDLWQRRLAELAVRLDGDVDFDVVHHATFAAYWTRVGVASVRKPLVWGPIGGGVTPPLRLLPVMGLGGAAGDLVRFFSRPIVALLLGARRTARQASFVLVQNPETAHRLSAQDTAVVLPNALIAARSMPLLGESQTGQDGPPRIVTAGRLIGWKGTELAIRAMQYIRHSEAILDVYGDGPQRTRLERLRNGMGLGHRVRFHGEVQRAVLQEVLAEAAVLVHPALHEEAGFVVVEALALGTPVVCLDRGGPPVIVEKWPDTPSRVVQPSTPSVTARRIALALDDLIGQRGEPDSRPAEQFTEDLLAAYSYAASGA